MTNSTWIKEIRYKRVNGQTFLALFLKDKDKPTALLYCGTPSWLPGLVHAGTGRRSLGLAYNRLVKGRYPYQRVEGSRVHELRRMMS